MAERKGSVKAAGAAAQAPTPINEAASTKAAKAAPATAGTLCYDGCGGKPLNPKSHFLPGHDARLHGVLTKVVRDEVPYQQIPKIARDTGYADTWIAEHADAIKAKAAAREAAKVKVAATA